jgi:hypothetical protein
MRRSLRLVRNPKNHTEDVRGFEATSVIAIKTVLATIKMRHFATSLSVYVKHGAIVVSILSNAIRAVDTKEIAIRKMHRTLKTLLIVPRLGTAAKQTT